MHSGLIITEKVIDSSGAKIVEVSIPTITASSLLYIVLSYTELASNLSRYTGVRYGTQTKENTNVENIVFLGVDRIFKKE